MKTSFRPSGEGEGEVQWTLRWLCSCRPNTAQLVADLSDPYLSDRSLSLDFFILQISRSHSIRLSAALIPGRQQNSKLGAWTASMKVAHDSGVRATTRGNGEASLSRSDDSHVLILDGLVSDVLSRPPRGRPGPHPTLRCSPGTRTPSQSTTATVALPPETRRTRNLSRR